MGHNRRWQLLFKVDDAEIWILKYPGKLGNWIAVRNFPPTLGTPRVGYWTAGGWHAKLGGFGCPGTFKTRAAAFQAAEAGMRYANTQAREMGA